jgi:hypothetical protein
MVLPLRLRDIRAQALTNKEERDGIWAATAVGRTRRSSRGPARKTSLTA